MNFYSNAFKNDEEIPLLYTPKGQNIVPPLFIENVDENVKSLAIIIDDIDGDFYTNWIVWNLDKNLREVSQNNPIPKNSVQGKTSSGGIGYNGPSHEYGTHRYAFRLYGLDAFLNIPLNSKLGDIHEVFDKHKLEYNEFIGIFTVK